MRKYLSRGKIFDRGKIYETLQFRDPNVGNISTANALRFRLTELAIKQVGQRFVLLCFFNDLFVWILAAYASLQSMYLHNPRHTFMIDRMAMLIKLHNGSAVPTDTGLLATCYFYESGKFVVIPGFLGPDRDRFLP